MRANEAAQAEQEHQQRAAYREQLLSNCDGMGFQRGTEAHANCVLSQHQQNMRVLGNAVLMQQQQQLQQRQLIPQHQQQQRLPVYTNCNTDRWGNMQCTTQ